MFISRLLLNGRHLKNGVAGSVVRRSIESSCFGTSDLNTPDTDSNKKNDSLVQRIVYLARVFRDEKGHLELSDKAKELDEKSAKKLSRYIELLDTNFTVGKAFVVTDVDNYDAVALCCVGPKDANLNDAESLDELKENTRCAIAGGLKALNLIISKCTIEYDEAADDEATIPTQEGATLGQWKPSITYVPTVPDKKDGITAGTIKATAQNWARHLSQMPTNKMTPELVKEVAKKQLSAVGVHVKAYDRVKIEEKKMSAFLAASEGSKAPPYLLECDYTQNMEGTDVLMVAAGVTFDCGGLCLKKPENLLRRSSMTGAAVALGTLWGLAVLKAQVNVKLLLPLCENMISDRCLKVGDVVQTLKGINVKVEDTGLERHLMLADALTYGQGLQDKPKYVLDVASLTPGIEAATGGNCYGCFTTSDDLWKKAQDAGASAGDRPWRFPIWDCYTKQITGDTDLFHLKNHGTGIASHCMGAAFLKEFISVDLNTWLHYDITGVERAAGAAPPYLEPAYMTGRPTRALIEAITTIVTPDDKGDCTGCKRK